MSTYLIVWCYSLLSLRWTSGGGGGGESAYERGGDARLKFWNKTPKGDQLGRGSSFFGPLKETMLKHRQYNIFTFFSRATLNETFTAKHDGVCPEHPKWDQNPKFTPLSKMTSIPTPFIFGVRFLHTVIKNIAITVRETQVMKAGKHWSWKLPDRAQSFVFCSQVVTEYSLFTDSIFSSKSTQRKGVVVGEEKILLYFSFLRYALIVACSLHSRARRCFWKEQKEK